MAGKIHRVCAVSLAALCLMSPALVHAAGQASGAFKIRARVPTACWVDHALVSDATMNSIGQVTEGCNNATGYVVAASYRSLLADEHARLIYGGKAFNLVQHGNQEISREYGPRIRTVNYNFEGAVLSSPLVLSLTIQPL